MDNIIIKNYIENLLTRYNTINQIKQLNKKLDFFEFDTFKKNLIENISKNNTEEIITFINSREDKSQIHNLHLLRLSIYKNIYISLKVNDSEKEKVHYHTLNSIKYIIEYSDELKNIKIDDNGFYIFNFMKLYFLDEYLDNQDKLYTEAIKIGLSLIKNYKELVIKYAKVSEKYTYLKIGMLEELSKLNEPK